MPTLQARASATLAPGSWWRPAARRGCVRLWRRAQTASRCDVAVGGMGTWGRQRDAPCCVCTLRPQRHAASTRDQVDANLAAADIPMTLFDAIVSADAFERLKPAPGACGEMGVAAPLPPHAPPSPQERSPGAER